MSPVNGRASLAGRGRSPGWATSSHRPKGGRAVPSLMPDVRPADSTLVGQRVGLLLPPPPPGLLGPGAHHSPALLLWAAVHTAPGPFTRSQALSVSLLHPGRGQMTQTNQKAYGGLPKGSATLALAHQAGPPLGLPRPCLV